MRRPNLRRRWILVIVAALVLAFAVIRAVDSPSWIAYYRVADEHTLVVGTVTGPGALTRITNVIETPSTVTITVSSFVVQLGPGAAVGVPVESTTTLRDPIGSRTVIDGSNGLPVQRTVCLPPAYFGPGCIP